MNVINTAIIGFGMSGRIFHAPIINCMKEFNLKTIYTTNSDSKLLIEKAYGDTAVTSYIRDILNDEAIQLVVIAAPNFCHYSLAADAINAGKNIVVDKPFTVTSEEAEALIRMAGEKKVLISAYHNRRWDSDFKTVKKILESQILGPLAECEIHMDRYRNYLKHSWKEEDAPGAGILYDLGPHMIDQALNLFGLPDAVTADLRIQRECARTVDNFELILHYRRLKVTLKAGMLVKTSLPRFILLGENGTFVKFGMDVQEEDLIKGLAPTDKKNWGREPEELHGQISMLLGGMNLNGTIESEGGDYREYYANIFHALRGEASLAVTPRQARDTIKIIEYAIESSKAKRTVNLV